MRCSASEFEFEGDGEEQPAGSIEAEKVESSAFGLSREEIEAMAASLEPGQLGGLLLVEHVWARDLKRAIRQTGGSRWGRLPHARGGRRRSPPN